MSLITGDGTTYPASFEGPDDGDERDASSHLVGLEALADRTEYLKDRVADGTHPITTSALTVVGDASIGDDLIVVDDLIVGGSTQLEDLVVNATATVDGDATVTGAVTIDGYVSVAGGYFLPTPESVTIAIDAPAETDDGWALDRSTNDFFWTSTTTSQRRLRVSLNEHVPRNANITEIVARFKGAPGHAGLPGGMPELILYRKRIGTTGAASGVIDSEFDPSADTTAFQAEHDIPLVLGAPHTADTSTHAYYAVITSESDGGANAIAGAEFHGLKVTYTYTRVDRT